ncbi:endonuclease/exonuclease/phosphatase family metal-dependent hydrolase [Lipingzhangella halophila]|uniref:Endonuclease/exonuclease/phosphatase family metal-dependent hydrolase n=1 Tax=Lipingzhangella halophila TaxID=1783352 RepID=A0A7W7RGI6_9ACTN|nr:endonuclease/exonuclease/phosphatase family protein [Lipingzhangella halophila]MBB4931581.1 endonuclease/exonuclease/phosphatase family metal-dependent hydrolase [Lipingzhangella halophila]
MADTQPDHGASFLEYSATIALVSTVAGAVLFSSASMGESVSNGIKRAIDCVVHIDRDCAVGSPEDGDAAAEDPSGAGPGNGDDDTLPVIDDGRAPGEYQIGSFNMAGGNADEYDPDTSAEALINSLEDRLPGVVAVQEACESDMDEVDSSMENYTTVFQQVEKVDSESGGRSGASCKEVDSPFGNALVVRDDMGFDTENEEVHELSPEDEVTEMRQMVCVTSETQQMAACTVHLTSGNGKEKDAIREEETAEVQRILAEEYGDYTVILGGDLNADPGSAATNNLYHEDYGDDAQGSLIDASGECGHELSSGCREGEGTLGSEKIDYVFVSDDVEVQGTHTGDPHHSDHDLVWSDVYIDPDS